MTAHHKMSIIMTRREIQVASSKWGLLIILLVAIVQVGGEAASVIAYLAQVPTVRRIFVYLGEPPGTAHTQFCTGRGGDLSENNKQMGRPSSSRVVGRQRRVVTTEGKGSKPQNTI